MDLLVKLYDLPPPAGPGEGEAAADGITIRRALAPEREPVLAWVERRFGPGWRGEAAAAFGTCPARIMLAVREGSAGTGQVLGFACWDVTARGLFGPTGVDEAARGLGLGRALLLAALRAMAAEGYAYAVIGGAGPVDFYAKACGAVPIPGSEPGLYRGLIRAG